MAFSAGVNLKRLLAETSFQGENKLTGLDGAFTKERVQVIDGVITAMEKKFQDLDHGILQATKLADLSTWPSELDDDTQGIHFSLEIVALLDISANDSY